MCSRQFLGDEIEDLLARYSVWGATSSVTSSEHSRQAPSSLKVCTPVAEYSDTPQFNFQQNTESSGDYLTPCGSNETAKNAQLKPPSVKKSLRLASRTGRR